jgi:hypothetical protein
VVEPESDAKPASFRPDDDDLRLGDLVVLMMEPGPFTVVEIDPPIVTIESRFGQRRRVHEVALRRVTGEPPVNT